jgi:hypothetical protein
MNGVICSRTSIKCLSASLHQQHHGARPRHGRRSLVERAEDFAAGSDTVAFERVPSNMVVHEHLPVESGIHIIEVLNLEELARDGVSEF